MRSCRVLAAAGVVLVAVRIRQRGWRIVEHDLIDHPLMTLWPALGDRLHDRDEPDVDEKGYDELLAELTDVRHKHAAETWRLIAAETRDPSHLDDLEARNNGSGFNHVEGRYDRRLAEIITRRRAELVALGDDEGDEWHPSEADWAVMRSWETDGTLPPDDFVQELTDDLTVPVDVRRCIGCGCTDNAACDPPCAWAQLDPPVCTTCHGRSTVIQLHPDRPTTAQRFTVSTDPDGKAYLFGRNYPEPDDGFMTGGTELAYWTDEAVEALRTALDQPR